MLTSLLLSSLLTIPTVFGQGGAGGGGVQYAGVNIPGMEFGCDTDVSFPTGQDPVTQEAIRPQADLFSSLIPNHGPPENISET